MHRMWSEAIRTTVLFRNGLIHRRLGLFRVSFGQERSHLGEVTRRQSQENRSGARERQRHCSLEISRCDGYPQFSPTGLSFSRYSPVLSGRSKVTEWRVPTELWATHRVAAARPIRDLLRVPVDEMRGPGSLMLSDDLCRHSRASRGLRLRLGSGDRNRARHESRRRSSRGRNFSTSPATNTWCEKSEAGDRGACFPLTISVTGVQRGWRRRNRAVLR